MENIQLNTIVEYLEMQDEKLNKLLEKSNTNNESLEINNLTKNLITLDKNYKDYMYSLKLFLEYIKKVKTELLDVSEKIPAEIHQTIKFNRDSRNQVWLTFIGIVFFLSTGIIAINYYNDNTNYKKAWNHLLEQDLSVKNRTYLNSILKNSK